MPEQGYYGTESNPWANLYGDMKVVTPQTTGGTLEEGEYRLRTDLNSGDKLATYELNVGDGVEEAPVYPNSMSVPSSISKVRQVYVANEGWGFVPVYEDGGSYNELAIYHDGSWWGWHDSLSAIPASAIHRLILDEEGSTFADSIGSEDATNNGSTRVTGDYQGGAARSFDGTDDTIDWTTLSTISYANQFSLGITAELDTLATDNVLWGHTHGTNDRVELGTDTDGNQTLSFTTYDGSAIVSRSVSTVSTGTRIRIGVRCDGPNDSIDIFINGSQSDDGTNRTTLDGTAGHKLGGTSGASSLYDGILDDAIVYNSLLSDSEFEGDYSIQPWA